MKRFVVGAVVVVSLSGFVGRAEAVPSVFQLVFDGKHVVADFPSPTGLAHVGPFTTNSPLCPSGYARDIAQTDQVATRLFTCDGTDATFTAVISPHLGEHGGGGSWQITNGTGALADFRGKGSFSSVLTGGTPDDFPSITFRSTWQGLVDLDATAPTVSLVKARVRKLHRPGSYVLNLRLAIRDGDGNAVSYILVLADPRDPVNAFARTIGEVATGSLARRYRLRVKPTTRRLRLSITATDPLGNAITYVSTIRLR